MITRELHFLAGFYFALIAQMTLLNMLPRVTTKFTKRLFCVTLFRFVQPASCSITV